jgi:hypothetical protein
MNGNFVYPQTETMAQIHNIRNITTGAIATCSILVCCCYLCQFFHTPNVLYQAQWALSGDNTLQEVGSSTRINYFNNFEEYLTILETSLHQRKKSVINIIKQWDEKIFPNSDSSLVKGRNNDESSGLKKAMDLLAADSEEEDNQLEGED